MTDPVTGAIRVALEWVHRAIDVDPALMSRARFIAILLATAAALAGCALQPPAVVRFAELPGFQPHGEFVLQANRTLALQSEGAGTFSTGDRFYYIAYTTEELVPETPPFSESTSVLGDPLWGEMQSLWKKRRAVLSPEDYRFVIIDARAAPGGPGSTTRRAVYVSSDGRWVRHHVSVSVFEHPGEGLPL